MHQDVVCQAIRAKRVLMVHHHTHGHTFRRVIEPYLLFATPVGELVLHSWQVEGEYEEIAPPAWCNLRLVDLRSITPLERFYTQPPPAYNPRSTAFHQVLYAVFLEVVRPAA